MPTVLAPLGARLELEQQLALATAYRQTLLAAMDALDRPAYLVSHGRVEHSNPAGASRLQEGGATMDDIRHLAAAGQASTSGSCFSVDEPGAPALQLVLLRPTTRDLSATLQRSVAVWRLSPRQAEVMTCLAEGDTNKAIASELGCAEVTVEFHVRGMFVKTGAQNRAELIALFWKL